MERKITLPFTKGTNYFFAAYFGMPAAVFILSHFQHGDAFTILHLIPLLLAIPFLILLLPVFRFNTSEKSTYKNAVTQLPFAERYVWLLLYCSAFASYLCSFQYLKGWQIEQDIFLFSAMGYLCIVLLLIAINHPRIRFSDSPDADRAAQRLAEQKADSGAFVYFENGFNYSENGLVLKVNWADITEVMAYKTDQFTVDCIHIAIKDGDGYVLDIDEDLPGYMMFVEHMHANLPNHASFWQLHVAYPPFELCPTLVYKKGTDLSGFREKA